jgi:hypothetical protein
MIFQVQHINQYRNNQLKSNKIYKPYLTIISSILIIYLVYIDIYYINKFINDKEFKEKTLTSLKDNLWWKTLLIIIAIIFIYYINFVYYKWSTNTIQQYRDNIFVNIIFPMILISHIIIYFMLNIDLKYY